MKFYRENGGERTILNGTHRYSEIVSEFNSVRSISGDRFLKHAFASWRRQLSSRVSSRHVTNFDISVRERKERKGLENRQGYACESIQRRKDGWSWYWLAFADTGAEFSTSLPSFFHLHPLYIYIYVYHSSSLSFSFFNFPPYKYTLRLIPSISFLLSSTISSVQRTNLPLSPSFPFPSIPKLSPPHLFLSHFFFIYV